MVAMHPKILAYYLRRSRIQQQGFSSIELVVVVAVLSILAAISIPSFNSIRIWLDETEAKTVGNGLLKSIANHCASEGSIPQTWFDISQTFRELKYCPYDRAVKRNCGTGVGDLVSTIDPSANPLNCIVVTQASYEVCAETTGSKFQFVIKEFDAIESPSPRKSVSGCYSDYGSRLEQQASREEVWIDC